MVVFVEEWFAQKQCVYVFVGDLVAEFVWVDFGDDVDWVHLMLISGDWFVSFVVC